MSALRSIATYSSSKDIRDEASSIRLWCTIEMIQRFTYTPSDNLNSKRPKWARNNNNNETTQEKKNEAMYRTLTEASMQVNDITLCTVIHRYMHIQHLHIIRKRLKHLRDTNSY